MPARPLNKIMNMMNLTTQRRNTVRENPQVLADKYKKAFQPGGSIYKKYAAAHTPPAAPPAISGEGQGLRRF
jgi:hypothetical protein